MERNRDESRCRQFLLGYPELTWEADRQGARQVADACKLGLRSGETLQGNAPRSSLLSPPQPSPLIPAVQELPALDSGLEARDRVQEVHLASQGRR